MPLAGVADAAKDYHAKKAAAESGGTLFFSLQDGEEATVRFLEEGDDFVTYWVHRLPQVGNRFPQIPCLDQSTKPSGRIPCPGCEQGIKRSFKFAVNLIRRNAPIPARDENNRAKKDGNGKIIWDTNPDGTAKVADQVMVWNGGINVAEDLDHLDGKYGGLTTLDFDIARRGVKLDTTYTILPAGQKTPMSDRDRQLASGKFDLNQFKKPPEYDEFFSYDQRGAGAATASTGPSAAEQSVRESPFKRRDRAA